MSSSVKKVVLAYSGGLDTSVIVKWLQENYQWYSLCFAQTRFMKANICWAPQLPGH